MTTISLQSPKEINLSGDVLALLQQVDEDSERLNALRPFSVDVADKIRRAFLPDRVTATLNIEGIAATRRQTLAIMDALVVAQQVAKEDQEIANALRADEFIFEASQENLPLDLNMLRHVNALLLEGVKGEEGGFRKIPVSISGAEFSPPEPADIVPMLQDVVDRDAEAGYTHPIAHAAWLHHQVAYVHPFIDGNGRTARLMQDFTLMRRGLFPVGIPSSQRDAYYQALQRADQGKWDDLVSLISQNQLSTLGKIEAIANESVERRRWIARLAELANQKKTGALYKQYVVWKTRMEQIRDGFCRASLELDQSSNVIGATERWHETIEFDDWKILSSTGRRPGFTWLFSLLFFIDGEPFYKLIAFVARHRRDANDFSDELSETVSLQFTGLPAKSDARPNFISFHDPDVRLREIMFHNDTMIVAYESTGSIAFSDEKALEEVIQDLFEDVFVKKGGLAG